MLNDARVVSGWYQLVSMSGHAKETDTTKTLEVYATSIFLVNSFVNLPIKIFLSNIFQKYPNYPIYKLKIDLKRSQQIISQFCTNVKEIAEPVETHQYRIFHNTTFILLLIILLLNNTFRVLTDYMPGQLYRTI